MKIPPQRGINIHALLIGAYERSLDQQIEDEENKQ